jgi:hypothetical protein
MMVSTLLTPIIHGMIAAIAVGFILLATVASGGPVVWAFMVAFGLLGFVSGIVRATQDA